MDWLDIRYMAFCIHRKRTRTKTNPNQAKTNTKIKRERQQLRSTYSGEVRLLDHLDGLTVDSLDEHVDVDV
jgi:hypothetical protein